MKLKDYQDSAILELLNKFNKLIQYSERKELVFKAPTGSGKTIMMAEFLKRLVDDYQNKGYEFAFIWTAPRKLHEQSKEKLEKYYEESRALECINFEDLSDRQIQQNEILFLNWESINKTEKNTIVKENEQDFYLNKIIANTLDEKRKIILIIDESHHHADSKISKKLIDDIQSSITIEVSATPILNNPDDIVTVQLEDVKQEGMIKKSVLLNPGFKNSLKSGGSLIDQGISTELASSTDDFILKTALEQREKLHALYKKAKIDINPLLLIQLPDRKTEQEENVKNNVINILSSKYKITTENGKLAIYLSEEKENLENIAKANHESEVLIFKQAIALGWDCPRAQIMVIFREWKSITFSIQTIGRIMRMPEPNKGHYELQYDILNHGYVYTNLAEIEIKEDLARGYISIYTSERIKTYLPIKMKSVYRFRQREKTRLSPLFNQIFFTKAEYYQLEKKIKTKEQKVLQKLVSDYEAKNIDNLAQEEISSNVEINTKNPDDLQKLFDYFVRNNLTPYYPEDRSIGRVKEAIYSFFEKKLNLIYHEDNHFEQILNIVLSDDNQKHFVNVIDLAKEEYKKLTETRESRLQETKDWEVPETLSITSDWKELKTKLSVMKPFYYDEKWKTEKAFIDILEKSKTIEWWFKNGDRDGIFFAVPYVEDNQEKPFYVDFIVKNKNGKIGLFDTKSGYTLEIAKNKNDGLQDYIKKNKNFYGGIVTNRNQQDYSGAWCIFNKKSSEVKMDDLSNWEILDI